MTLDHVAIAVRSIHRHLPIYTKKLGMRLEGIYTIRGYGVRIASLKLPNARIELLEPLGKKSTLTGFLKKRGEGLHHLAFRVKNLEQAVSRLGHQGLQWINKTPRRGLHNSRVCFLHPSSTGDVLLEFITSSPSPLPLKGVWDPYPNPRRLG